MASDPVNHAVDLFYRDWLGGYRPQNMHLAPQLKFYFTVISKDCRKRHGGLCRRCPDCACMMRTVERAGIDLRPHHLAARDWVHPSLERGKHWKGPVTPPPAAGKPPQPPPRPPRKSPAVAMPRPQPPIRTDAVSMAARPHHGKTGTS